MNPESSPQPPSVPPKTAEDAARQPEEAPQVTSGSEDNNIAAAPVSSASSADQQQPHIRVASAPGDQHALLHPPENPFEPTRAPSTGRSRHRHGRHHHPHLASMIAPSLYPRSTSQIDWIVPVEEKSTRRRTVGERLQATVENAEMEREKYAIKAFWTSYALNIAIALQVFLGALTTGIAAGVRDARQAQVSTAVLGGLSTIVASYLARARGSGEPEASTRRVKDLEHFLRDCRAFQIDHAHEYTTPGDRLDYRVESLRRKLEEMLGNVMDGTSGEDKRTLTTGVAFGETADQLHSQNPTQVQRVTIP